MPAMPAPITTTRMSRPVVAFAMICSPWNAPVDPRNLAPERHARIMQMDYPDLAWGETLL